MFEGIYDATQQVMTQAGVDRINTVGYCIGGTLLSCALAHMAAKGDKRIGSATFFAAQQDFSEAGDLLLFTDETWIKTIEEQIDRQGGYLPSQSMADTFNSLRGNDLIWSFFINNYLMGKEPRPFDLLFWNADQTRMPKRLHMEYLRRFYRDNALALGQLDLGAGKLDLLLGTDSQGGATGGESWLWKNTGTSTPFSFSVPRSVRSHAPSESTSTLRAVEPACPSSTLHSAGSVALNS